MTEREGLAERAARVAKVLGRTAEVKADTLTHINGGAPDGRPRDGEADALAELAEVVAELADALQQPPPKSGV